MPILIASLEKIKTLGSSELKVLAKELFHLEENGVYPKNSKLKELARGIANQLDGIHLNHAQDMVNSEVLRVIARKFVSEE
jgi:hypothetical protein